MLHLVASNLVDVKFEEIVLEEKKFDLNSPENAFVRAKFREYYSGQGRHFQLPYEFTAREFGVGFEDKIDYRHKSFANENEVRDYLAREAPFYISYSTARYSLPGARPMEKKGFLGADIAFDLDKPKRQPEHDHSAVMCEFCLEKTRDDALLFVEDFLLDDFGLSEKEVQTNFSGSKGYHFHVRTPDVQKLSSIARKELCDYAAAFGVEADKVFTEEKFGTRKAEYSLLGPSLESKGWSAKVFKSITSFVERADEALCKQEGLSPQKTKLFLEKRGEILQKISSGRWSALQGLEEFWKQLATQAISIKRVELDAPVSFDMARLIRLPGSLHGDTGLLTVTLSKNELSKFEPLKDAVVFKKGFVQVEGTPFLPAARVVFMGQEFGIVSSLKTEVPEGLAVMLLRKGKAKLA